MKKLLLSTMVMFFAVATADACETKVSRVVAALPNCQVKVKALHEISGRVMAFQAVPGRVMALQPLAEIELPEIAGIVSLLDLPDAGAIAEIAQAPNMMEIQRIAANARTALRAAPAVAEAHEASRGGVVVTVLSALGKAMLKAVAVVIHHLV